MNADWKSFLRHLARLFLYLLFCFELLDTNTRETTSSQIWVPAVKGFDNGETIE